jgi:hypothetical protein
MVRVRHLRRGRRSLLPSLRLGVGLGFCFVPGAIPLANIQTQLRAPWKGSNGPSKQSRRSGASRTVVRRPTRLAG